MRANVFFVFLMAVGFILMARGEGGAISLLSSRDSNTMLIVPARPGVLQLAFDLTKMRDITLISFRGKAADKPLLHVWTGNEWQYVSLDDFCSLRFIGETPKTVIVIGDDQTVPKALLQGMNWPGRIARLPTINTAELINGFAPYFKFNAREWQQLANSYDLTLKGANVLPEKQVQETNVLKQAKGHAPPVVPAEKSTAAFPDKKIPAAVKQKPDNEFFLYLSEAPRGKPRGILAEPSEAKDAIPPCGKPQGFLAKEGEDDYISFIWIAPLSIWVGQYETTNAQYGQFNRAHDPKRYYDHIMKMPDQPAVLVSWENANNYCRWLNRNFNSQLPAGFECRLPTENEWIAFAKCGREVKYPWGDQWPPPDSFNYKGTEGASIFYGIFHNEKFIRGHNDGFIVAAPVDKSGTNEWGLYGVGGNVWEWCQDWFDDTKTTRALRGAAWNNYEPAILAISNRSDALPEKSNAMIGFRIVIAPRKK